MPNAAVSVDVLSENVDVDELRTDLSVFGESVEVERSAAAPQMFFEPFLPAIITIKMAWAAASPYLLVAGSALLGAVGKEIAAEIVKHAKEALVRAYKKAKASGYQWRSKSKTVDGPPLRAEFSLPPLPGVDGRVLIVVFPNRLTEEHVETGLSLLGEAVKLAEGKRQQEVAVLKQIAELNAAGKEEEATEMYIVSRETIRDWMFVYDADEGWVDANVLIEREANRGRGLNPDGSIP